MSSLISSIHFCPVKSLSFSSIQKSFVKKDLGILNDRIFSFTRNIDFKKAKLIEKYPQERKLNYFISLKNTPALNKYKFSYDEKLLTLNKDDKIIISISTKENNKYNIICNKLIELEESLLKPIFLLNNKTHPFFDTTHSTNVSNTISLVNINSIEDFKKKTNETLEYDRFRGNFYIDGLYPWEERNWLNKIIKINKTRFKVEKNISRCSATNLQPNTDKITINLPMTLKKHYNHIDMGVYITPLENGEINIGDKIILDE